MHSKPETLHPTQHDYVTPAAGAMAVAGQPAAAGGTALNAQLMQVQTLVSVWV